MKTQKVILRTLQTWLPKLKKIKIEKFKFVISETPTTIDYKEWFNQNNNQ